jgi:hypothetical protein
VGTPEGHGRLQEDQRLMDALLLVAFFVGGFVCGSLFEQWTMWGD